MKNPLLLAVATIFVAGCGSESERYSRHVKNLGLVGTPVSAAESRLKKEGLTCSKGVATASLQYLDCRSSIEHFIGMETRMVQLAFSPSDNVVVSVNAFSMRTQC